MKRVKRIVATTGEYTDKDGNSKKQYATIGTLFEREDGSQSIKIEAVPVGWSGWASFYDLEEKRAARQEPAKSSPAELDDEIPF